MLLRNYNNFFPAPLPLLTQLWALLDNQRLMVVYFFFLEYFVQSAAQETQSMNIFSHVLVTVGLGLSLFRTDTDYVCINCSHETCLIPI